VLGSGGNASLEGQVASEAGVCTLQPTRTTCETPPPRNRKRNRDCFRQYVAQDAHFLHFFARAYAAALDKCADALDPEARVVIQQLLMGVHMELRLHGAYARTWGIDHLEELDEVNPATSAYTDFLIEVAEDPEVSPCAAAGD